jgi:hypothetical protein
MDYLLFLPKKIIENIQNNYIITNDLLINQSYAIYKNKEFIENTIIKNIHNNDVHIFYQVKTLGKDYMRNEIIPRDKVIFFNHVQTDFQIKNEDKSKQRLKDFFKKNYLKK